MFLMTLLSTTAGLYFTASPSVNITNGTLEGSIANAQNGRDFIAFQGIPYALPPIGELRFEVPQPPDSWNGTRSAKNDGSRCVQEGLSLSGFVGSEDCLYLNVYTPRLPTTDNANKMPVMVWFHGGAFTSGSGDFQYYNPKYFLNKDVVFVGINYRLGPLGFFSTEDLILPGNLAMKDQVQALRWIQENIAAFGGDPNSVTIFGESAGGACVHLHMMSPLSKGLFHRGISQSGTAMNPWSVSMPGRPKRLAMRVAKLLNCPSTNSSDIVTCLRTKSAIDIVRTTKNFLKFGMDPMVIFSPVVEPNHPGAFLSKSPYELFSTGKSNDVPWLTGLTSHEGAIRLIIMDAKEATNSLEVLNSKWKELGPLTLGFKYTCKTENHTEIAMKIKEFYLGDKNISDDTRSELTDMYSDFWFRNGVRESIKLHTKYLKSPIYQYRFAYKGIYSYSTMYAKTLWKKYGVSHADDLLYFFPMQEFKNFAKLPIGEEHENLVNVMTTMWYNFAKTGNPTPEITEDIPIKWLPISTKAFQYLDISSPTNLTMVKYKYSKKRAFFNRMPECIRISTRHKKKIIKSNNRQQLELVY